jgi:peptide/nickel transport system permease protein
MKLGRKGRVALALLAGVHAVVLGAGFLAPYDYALQERTLPFAPPTPLRFVDESGRFHLRPFVYALVDDEGAPGRYREDRSRRFPLRFLVQEPPAFPGAAATRRLFGVEEPARLFLLGSDGFGRDQLSRLLHGGRVSLLTGLLAAAAALALGLLLGGVAGFYGRRVDEVVMGAAELFLALPWLYLVLAVRAFLPLHVTPGETVLLLVAVITLIDWAPPARLVRGVVLSARERPYVLASRGFGASDLHLLRVHVLPEAFGVVLTQAALLVPRYVLAEVSLSFLGLGVTEPAPSWGNMLGTLQQYHVLASYWWMLAPGLALILVFVAYSSLASALQARVGPRAG